MPGEHPLTYELFLQMARQAGLDTTGPHLAELFPYVQSVLASLEPLRGLAVAEDEPDMAFLPCPE